MIAALVGMKRNIITLFARGKKINQVHTPVCFWGFAGLVNEEGIRGDIIQITGLSSAAERTGFG